MARPKTISNEKILEKARELFLARGVSVTTAEIASAAGISEGTIFKRFPTKQALFFAAMGIDEFEDWAADLPSLAGKGTVRKNLIGLAGRVMKVFQVLQPKMMMLWSSRHLNPKELHPLIHGPDSPPRRNHAALAQYLRQEMALGRIRAVDPDTVVDIFLGTIWKRTFFKSMGMHLYDPVSEEVFASNLVDTLWNGLTPPNPPKKGGQ